MLLKKEDEKTDILRGIALILIVGTETAQ